MVQGQPAECSANPAALTDVIYDAVVPMLQRGVQARGAQLAGCGAEVRLAWGAGSLLRRLRLLRRCAAAPLLPR